MQYNAEMLNYLNGYIDNYLNEMTEKYYKNSITCKDKIDHIVNVDKISHNISDDPLVHLAAKWHDVGRFSQYEILGNFNDRIVTHHVLGENFIEQGIQNGKLQNCPELDAIRSVVLYHGRERLIPSTYEISPEVMNIIKKVSMVDDIENGCIGVLGYLQRERDEDAKGYVKSNPELDMKSVSPYVLEKYTKGEGFDKNVYCHTYADYALFATTLAIKCLRGPFHDFCKQTLDQPFHGFNNGLEGYRAILEDMVDPKLVDLCYNVLLTYYNRYIPYPTNEIKDNMKTK